LADAFDQRDLIPTAVNWACGWPTIKSFLPPIKLPTEVYPPEDFPRARERQKKSP
jgi:hypothetical protein